MDYMNVYGDTDPELPEGHDAPSSDKPPKFGSNLRSSIRFKVHNLPGSHPPKRKGCLTTTMTPTQKRSDLVNLIPLTI
jgi:hypothetical protein